MTTRIERRQEGFHHNSRADVHNRDHRPREEDPSGAVLSASGARRIESKSQQDLSERVDGVQIREESATGRMSCSSSAQRAI